jgi:hypothetical protein
MADRTINTLAGEALLIVLSSPWVRASRPSAMLLEADPNITMSVSATTANAAGEGRGCEAIISSTRPSSTG